MTIPNVTWQQFELFRNNSQGLKSVKMKCLPKNRMLDIQNLTYLHSNIVPRRMEAYRCSPHQLKGFLGLLFYCFPITAPGYKNGGFEEFFYTAISYHDCDGIIVMWDSLSHQLKIKVKYEKVSHAELLSCRVSQPAENQSCDQLQANNKILKDFESSFKRKTFYDTYLLKHMICCGYEFKRNTVNVTYLC
jgi:hypothetical protein